MRQAKSPQDLEYLRAKGVFSLPPSEVCHALIQTYFAHVHPILPILDATTFLTRLTQRGYRSVNLLLLWSIIFMATSVSTIRSTHGQD